MASTYLELLIEPALEYQSSFQLRMNDFCRNHEVDESYYIKRELETWEKILIDIQNPEGTYDGYGHILSHDILDQIEKKIDYERLVIETEKKVTFINSLLKNDKTSQHDPGKHETLLKFFSALKNIQPRFYISEPDILGICSKHVAFIRLSNYFGHLWKNLSCICMFKIMTLSHLFMKENR